MKALFKIAWRSIWRNKRRTGITVSAIAFALAIAVIFISFGDGIYAQMIDNAAKIQAGHITLEHPLYRDAAAVDLSIEVSPELVAKLEALPGVSTVKSLILAQGVAKTGRGASAVLIIGVDAAKEKDTSPLAKKIVEGTYLEAGDKRKVIIGASLADRLKVTIGKKIIIATNDAHGQTVEALVRVKGIFNTGAEESDGYMIQLPLAFTRKLIDLPPHHVTQAGLVLKSADSIETILPAAKAIAQKSGAVAHPWDVIMPELSAYITMDGGSNKIFQGILLFLSLFTIFNTILMSVLERKREFAVMLALGTSPMRIRLQVLLESFLLGLLGAAVGLGLGGGYTYYLQKTGVDMGQFMEEGMSVSGFSFDTIVYAQLNASLVLTLGALIVTAVVLTSIIAVRRISSISVATVLR